MEGKLFRGVLFLAALLLLPAIPTRKPAIHKKVDLSLTRSCPDLSFLILSDTLLFPGSSQNLPENPDDPPLTLPAVYQILDANTGKVLRLTPQEYLIGVTAAEMPASYEPEALKAQAVAAHSYALWQMGVQSADPDPELKGALLSTDPSRFQAYLSFEERQSLWGKQAEAYEKKLRSAVEAVTEILLTYEKKPIAAAFHAISSGKTEAAEDVWGAFSPCLVSVESALDKDSSAFSQTLSFSAEEAASILKVRLKEPELSGSPAEWIRPLTRSAAGSVLTASAGGKTVSGQELRQWFSLPSANFAVSATKDGICFQTKGIGHGVGMSQYGANAMATEGKSFSEILLHYYPGAELTQVKTEG